MIADKVLVQGVLGNTVGRVGKVAGRLLLGKVPETATSGSFQEEKPLEDAVPPPAAKTEESAKFIDSVDEADKSLLEDEIFDQVFANGNKDDSSTEREWKIPEAETQKELSTV